MIETAAGTISNVDVTAESAVTNVTRSGLLVNTLNAGASVSGCNVVVKSAVDVGTSTFGGITGSANATLTGNTVSATFNVTGESAVIGGQVGEMTGGSISGGEVNGTIKLASGTGEGKNYIVGGAVGKAGAGTSYSGVTATVKVDDTWGTPAFCDGVTDAELKAKVSPDAKGPVGQFVGYVDANTSFTSCSGNGNSGYNFLGQVKANTITLGENTYGGYAEQLTTYEATDAADLNTYKNDHSANGKSILQFNTTLTDCFYVKAGTNYQQKINNTEYYYDGTTVELKEYNATKVEPTATTTTGYHSVESTISEVINRNTDDRVQTDYYYLRDGKYYQVRARRQNGGYYDYRLRLYCDFNNNGRFDDYGEQICDIYGDRNTVVDDVTLYIYGERTTYTLNLTDDDKYMIVGADKHALSGTGSAVNFTATFPESRQDLVGTIWTKTGNKWNQGSNYLSLIWDRNGTSIVGTSNDTDITCELTDNGESICMYKVNDRYNSYLTYNGSSFGVGFRQDGDIDLYRVAYTETFRLDFSNERVGQLIASVDLGAASSVSEVSEEAEPVATEPEATEPEVTEPVATEPEVTEPQVTE